MPGTRTDLMALLRGPCYYMPAPEMTANVISEPALPTPKRLVLDLLSSGRAIPVAALVKAATWFEISPNRLRVALTRLRDAGMVEAIERGVYTLGPRAVGVNRRVSAWRERESRVRRWDGAWIAVHVGHWTRSDRTELRVRERAFRFVGLRELHADLWLRPDNLRGGVPCFREELADLGVPGAWCATMTDLDSDSERRARGLWATRSLNRSHQQMRRALERSLVEVPALDDAQALRETFLMGGEAIRRIVLAPLLPEPLADVAVRRALLASMRRYDRMGQRIWHRVLSAREAA